MIRLKFLSKVNPSLPHDRIPRPEDSVSFLPMDHIGENGELDLTDIRPAKEISRGYTAFLDKDVIVAKITPCFENGKGALCQGLCGGVGFGTTELIVLRPNASMNPRFLYWLTRSHEFRRGGEAEMTGSAGQKRVTEAFVSNFLIPEISFHHQHRIAAHLDRQTEKIDRLMNLRKRQIELLKEQRAAIIQKAVTRGLNPDAPMKHSGIPWLGEIPAHWEMVRMKMLEESLIAGPFGSSITKDMYVSSGYRVYGQEQVIPDDFSIGDYFITPEKFHEMSRYSVKSGDILISCVGTFGKVAVVPKNVHPGIINPRLLRLRPRKRQIVPEYLGAVLRSNVGFAQMQQAGRGGTMDVINISLLGQIRLPLPPQKEQADILEYTATQAFRLDTLSSLFSRQLALLAEYRAALIHECVTGRKEIPEMPSPAREVAHAL